MKRLFVLAVLAAACANNKTPAPSGPRVPEELKVEVLAAFPHDRTAFTQGLLYAGGKLYESTGNTGQSSLRRVDPTTGKVEKRIDHEAIVFAEGLALVGHELIQLSWKNGRAFVYQADTFERLREHSYTGEGWGLSYDGKRLIMSDGSARLTFRDPKTFEPTGGIEVTRKGTPATMLNELEYVDGQIWANVWQTDLILRIDPTSGEVTAVVDAAGLLTPSERALADVLNGIAYLPDRNTFYITGKYWPKLFEVRFK